MTIESDTQNYNKVKDIVIRQVCDEGYMTEEEAEEFIDRNQVLVYKGTWFTKWFQKNVSTSVESSKDYYMRIIQMRDKTIDTNNTALRNRKIKAGVYKSVFKKLLTKNYPDIMDKNEVDFTEIVFHTIESELLDTINISFKNEETLQKYKKEHQDFLSEANEIALTLGFKNGIQIVNE